MIDYFEQLIGYNIADWEFLNGWVWQMFSLMCILSLVSVMQWLFIQFVPC